MAGSESDPKFSLRSTAVPKLTTDLQQDSQQQAENHSARCTTPLPRRYQRRMLQQPYSKRRGCEFYKACPVTQKHFPNQGEVRKCWVASECLVDKGWVLKGSTAAIPTNEQLVWGDKAHKIHDQLTDFLHYFSKTLHFINWDSGLNPCAFICPYHRGGQTWIHQLMQFKNKGAAPEVVFNLLTMWLRQDKTSGVAKAICCKMCTTTIPHLCYVTENIRMTDWPVCLTLSSRRGKCGGSEENNSRSWYICNSSLQSWISVVLLKSVYNVLLIWSHKKDWCWNSFSIDDASSLKVISPLCVSSPLESN